jgi:hypothetical protein
VSLASYTRPTSMIDIPTSGSITLSSEAPIGACHSAGPR